MTTRPLELTKPSHGVAVGAYWLGALLGLSYLLPGVNVSPAIVEALTWTGYYSWATGMLVCGVLALACAVASIRPPERLEQHLDDHGLDRARRILITIKLERFACLGLALTFLVYLYALNAPALAELPPRAGAQATWNAIKTTLTTKLLAATYVLGGLARVVQITREVRKWERGVADPRPANPPPLADPDR